MCGRAEASGGWAYLGISLGVILSACKVKSLSLHTFGAL